MSPIGKCQSSWPLRQQEFFSSTCILHVRGGDWCYQSRKMLEELISDAKWHKVTDCHLVSHDLGPRIQPINLVAAPVGPLRHSAASMTTRCSFFNALVEKKDFQIAFWFLAMRVNLLWSLVGYLLRRCPLRSSFL